MNQSFLILLFLLVLGCTQSATVTKEDEEAMVKAKTLYLKGKLTEAEPVFAAIAKSEPISSPQVSAAIALGDIYTSTGRTEKALELYDDLLERVGEIGEVHLVVGRAYAAQQQTDRAIAAYKKALEISPTYIFLWVELGQLYGQQGDQEKSTQALLEYEKQIYAIAKALERNASLTLSPQTLGELSAALNRSWVDRSSACAPSAGARTPGGRRT